jgi:hypothetical protein
MRLEEPPMPKRERTPQEKTANLDYLELISSRLRSQQLALRLYDVYSKQLAKNGVTEYWYAYGLLAGAIFSLWRGVFLTAVERTRANMEKHANELLIAVIENNSVPFQKERDTQQWMGGYYLNNVRYRLYAIRRDDRAWNFLKENDRDNECGRRLEKFAPEIPLGPEPPDLINFAKDLCDACDEVIKLFEAAAA